MRKLLASATATAAVLVAATMFAHQAAEVPAPLVFEAKNGSVTFDHAAHLEATGGECSTCHPAVWPQEKGDLGYKASMHRKAEADKTSCATCHRTEGSAFETKGNCARCHVKE